MKYKLDYFFSMSKKEHLKNHNTDILPYIDTIIDKLDINGVDIPYLNYVDIPASLKILSIGGPYLMGIGCKNYNNGGINGNFDDNYGSLDLKKVETLNIQDVSDLFMYELLFTNFLKKIIIKNGFNINFNGMYIPSTLDVLSIDGLEYDYNTVNDRYMIKNIIINRENEKNLKEFILIRSDVSIYSDLPIFPRNICKIILVANSFINSLDIFNKLCKDYPFVGEIKVDEYHILRNENIPISITYKNKFNTNITRILNIHTTTDYDLHIKEINDMKKEIEIIKKREHLTPNICCPGIHQF